MSPIGRAILAIRRYVLKPKAVEATHHSLLKLSERVSVMADARPDHYTADAAANSAAAAHDPRHALPRTQRMVPPRGRLASSRVPVERSPAAGRRGMGGGSLGGRPTMGASLPVLRSRVRARPR